MKTSARNAFHCEVIAVTRAAVNAQVELQVTDSSRIFAIITRQSADDLQLAPGGSVIALVKSSFVLLAGRDDATHVSVQNRLDGTVLDRVDGGVNSEIEIDIGGGKTLVSVITRRSADALGLRTGEPVSALFDAGHVILVIDEPTRFGSPTFRLPERLRRRPAPTPTSGRGGPTAEPRRPGCGG